MNATSDLIRSRLSNQIDGAEVQRSWGLVGGSEEDRRVLKRQIRTRDRYSDNLGSGMLRVQRILGVLSQPTRLCRSD